jgi:hypothetical protein
MDKEWDECESTANSDCPEGLRYICVRWRTGPAGRVRCQNQTIKIQFYFFRSPKKSQASTVNWRHGLYRVLREEWCALLCHGLRTTNPNKFSKVDSSEDVEPEYEWKERKESSADEPGHTSLPVFVINTNNELSQVCTQDHGFLENSTFTSLTTSL